MTKVLAGITTSVDGYITGPNDGPAKGLGDGGERLHYWVFGRPWTYVNEPRGEPSGEDAAWLAQAMSRVGAVVGGRWTYEAARHWGDESPWGLPFFILGGAEVIRQALEAGIVDELTVIIAPVILGAGKRLFEGFSQSLDLEHLGVRQSRFATFIDYRVTPAGGG
jgi:hypothetical protein